MKSGLTSHQDCSKLQDQWHEMENLRIKKRRSLGNLWKRVSGCQGVLSGCFKAAIINTIITRSLDSSENIQWFFGVHSMLTSVSKTFNFRNQTWKMSKSKKESRESTCKETRIPFEVHIFGFFGSLKNQLSFTFDQLKGVDVNGQFSVKRGERFHLNWE